MKAPLVTPWTGSAPPNESTLWRMMAKERLNPYSWTNAPFDAYAAHSHCYDKVIYVVHGSITFGLPDLGKQWTLQAGDRLDLPAGVVHEAYVGAGGVVCLEGHKY